MGNFNMQKLLTLALALFAALSTAKDLRGGNVLESINGVKSWGEWIPDLIFVVLLWVPMFWCNIQAFLSGLAGDNLIGFQKCWAGWFNIIYGGNW
eukprot:NODE_9908_length_352_cov_32.006601_g9000_i0.p1 GENE.NODE_9908_length_352_cov_32.006601_g9000_i0~~NODE_9908_length_352_cov_32.006601_g9000_i0.p1  ORF type:complete len:105 (+),score=27.45 NODE_9908_length_352_cov_32.006601_g9000_i0:33-317(+)